MPKTIAITPSWYWPQGVPRVLGVPPFDVVEYCVGRNARHRPNDAALVGQDGSRFDWAGLDETVKAAAGSLRARTQGGPITLCAGPSLEGAILVLSALASGSPVRLAHPQHVPNVAPGSIAVLADATCKATAAAAGVEVLGLGELTQAGATAVGPVQRDVAALAYVGSDGRGVWHSHRSLLAAGLSFGAFLGNPGRPAVSTEPLWGWHGVCAMVTVLASGSTLVLGDPGEAALESVGREGAGALFAPLDAVADWTRDAKLQVKHLRGALNQIVLWTEGAFDPDKRRRVGKMFECPALTAWGLAETGAVFVSHPSWYVDESVGIPMTNAHVVPVEPRTGAAIVSLWELVESARVTVYTPALCVGYDQGSGPPNAARDERFQEGRLVTGLIASSDANGMIYLLPD